MTNREPRRRLKHSVLSWRAAWLNSTAWPVQNMRCVRTYLPGMLYICEATNTTTLFASFVRMHLRPRPPPPAPLRLESAQHFWSVQCSFLSLLSVTFHFSLRNLQPEYLCPVALVCCIFGTCSCGCWTIFTLFKISCADA